MNAVRETLQGVLDRSAAEDAWDMEPTLAIILDVGEGTEVALEPVPVGADMWLGAPPFRVIQEVAAVMGMAHEVSGWTPFSEGVRMLGVVLFSEGWGVTENTPEAARVLQAWMGEGHRLAEHPLAVEVKMVHAVLTDDSQVSLMYGRPPKTVPNGEEGTVEGRIPDALRDLLGVLRPMAASA